MAEDEVESVAQAFYGAQECARGWEREPKVIKERFRSAARAALEALEVNREITTPHDIPPRRDRGHPPCAGVPHELL